MTRHLMATVTPVTPVTRGPAHHFFGYYDKTPWSADGRTMLAMRFNGDITSHRGGEVAALGLIDLQNGNAFAPFDETRAWSWQQGCMLQWMGSASEREVIYNQFDGERLVAIVRDVVTGATRTLPRPIYCLSRDGTKAVSLNFARLATTRPGYGYPIAADPWRDQQYPDDDGVYVMDTQSGESRLIFSLRDAVDFELDASDRPAMHWFNHAAFNTEGSRILFLHRWPPPDGRRGWATRLLTIDVDGGDPYVLNSDDMTSHYDWRDADHVIAWATRKGIGDRYFLFRDGTQEAEIIGEDVFSTDGHMSYSPDRQWFVTDTYPDKVDSKRTLMLYHPATSRRIDLDRFYSPPVKAGDCRCDLLPRWNRDGTQICIDSMHMDNQRQMYVVDVSEITRGSA